jgi:hypothetical protein
VSARLNLHHLFLGILNDFAALRVPTEIAINGAFCAPHLLFGALWMRGTQRIANPPNNLLNASHLSFTAFSESLQSPSIEGWNGQSSAFYALPLILLFELEREP